MNAPSPFYFSTNQVRRALKRGGDGRRAPKNRLIMESSVSREKERDEDWRYVSGISRDWNRSRSILLRIRIFLLYFPLLPFCKKECFMLCLFLSLRVSFLLEHFELEIQFLEIENLRFTFHFARRSVASWFLWVWEWAFFLNILNWRYNFWKLKIFVLTFYFARRSIAWCFVSFCKFKSELSFWTF